MTQIILMSPPLCSQFVAAQRTGHAGQASTLLQVESAKCKTSLLKWTACGCIFKPQKSILSAYGRINLLFLPQNVGIKALWTLFAARERIRHLKKTILLVPRGLQHKANSNLKKLILVPFLRMGLVSDTHVGISEFPPSSSALSINLSCPNTADFSSSPFQSWSCTHAHVTMPMAVTVAREEGRRNKERATTFNKEQPGRVARENE